MFTMRKKTYREITADFYSSYMEYDDYYTEGGRRNGEWFGRLAEDLGLTIGANVDPHVMREIGENKFKGKKLTRGVTPGRIKPDAVRWFDFQCAPPKSVSVLAVVRQDARIRAAHERCVRLALTELERFTAYRLRIGINKNTNNTVITGNLLAALYQHSTSRALDPQLHTHCLVANCTKADNGEYMALTEKEMVQAVGYAGRFYQNALCTELRKLGYQIRVAHSTRGVNGFEISGVPDSVIELYSKRSEVIKNETMRQELVMGRKLTSAEVAQIAKESKESKRKEISTAAVLENCWRQLSDSEKTALRKCSRSAAIVMSQNTLPPRKGEIIKHIALAVNKCFEHQSVVHKYEVLETALKTAFGKFSAKSLADEAQRQLITVKQNTTELCGRVTTLQNIELEKSTLELAQRGIGARDVFGNFSEEHCNISGKQLSAAQREAVRGVCNNNDDVQIFRGVAGSGKTTALQAIATCLAGRDVLYLAPTNAAVNVLKADGFSHATTVSSFFLSCPKISNKSIIIIDEASLLSLEMGHDILYRANQAGARVLFVGDRRQHFSVAAGDFLRILEQHSTVKSVELTEIRRQQPIEYRQAIEDMSAGNTLAGLERLERMGVVQSCASQYLTAAARAYMGAIIAKQSVTLVAPTHAEVDALHEIIRDQLVSIGQIVPEQSQQRTIYIDQRQAVAQRQDIANYEKGMHICVRGQKEMRQIIEVDNQRSLLILDDGRRITPSRGAITSVGIARDIPVSIGERLLITANNKAKGLVNGDYHVVTGFDSDGGIITNKGAIPANFNGFNYGYATTSHKSQGNTTDVTILAASSLDDRACYVGSSRGRKEIKIFCPDLQYLKNRVRRNSDRLAVSDITGIKLR